MKRLLLVVLLVQLILLVAISCTPNNMDNKIKSQDKVEEVVNTYKNISPEDAKRRLDTEEGVVLLDVRTVEEYTEKHIPESILIPVDILENEAHSKLLDTDAHIFVYCRSGNRSVTASKILVKLGYKNVYNLGGIIDWPYGIEVGSPE